MLKYMESNLLDGETHSPALLSSVINIDAILHDVRRAPNAMCLICFEFRMLGMCNCVCVEFVIRLVSPIKIHTLIHE